MSTTAAETTIPATNVETGSEISGPAIVTGPIRTSHNPDTTVFIGNVAHETTKEELENVFEAEYPDVRVEMPVKEHTGAHVSASKHAFAIFPTTIDFDAIKEKYDTTTLHEREIHIKRVRNLEPRRGGFRGGRGGFRGRGAFRGGRGGFNGGASRPFQKKEKIPLDQMERSKDTLYVNNLPYSATKEELAELFGTKPELVVLPKRRMRDETTKKVVFSETLNRGIAFITFENLSGDIADKREEFQGKTLEERELVVDVAVVKPKREEHVEEAHPDAEESHEEAQTENE
ncbi:hypothetical protein NCAS_0C05920 [Naumovozyma castellii]|uniref:RRM domain-containing protein n=1 Tax=Naumovozyma castellii TaxID=27288 RepID=G0VDM0_NAUCA|nr:hypothetical protein NCAS_0C05920 [Naumovozyma castellii CBS 4309]CCC69582.1 hypothetical protein NCAS_0C05920 [Naumovozyma castellii CBS 4309]